MILPELWASLFQVTSVEPTVDDRLLMESANQRIFDYTALKRLSGFRDASSSSPQRQIEASSLKMPSMRYAAGYVTRKLINKFRRQSSKEADTWVFALNRLKSLTKSQLVKIISTLFTNILQRGWKKLTVAVYFMSQIRHTDFLLASNWRREVHFPVRYL